MIIYFEVFLCAALSFLSIVFAVSRQTHHSLLPAKNRVAYMMLMIYAIVVMSVAFFPIQLRISRTLRVRSRIIPFEDIMYVYARDGGIFGIELWKNFADSLFLFMPLGFLVPFVLKVNYRRILALGFLVALFVEGMQILLQLFLRGGRMVSTDDVMLSTLGAFLGFLLFGVAMKLRDVLQQRAVRQHRHRRLEMDA